MARRFRVRDGRVVGRMDGYEVELLRGLVGDVLTIVRDDDPDNPLTRRLFPDPSPDPETAAELRALIHDDLREAKLANARALLESLGDDGRISLEPDTAEQWLSALNDLRLSIGTAIGLTEETELDSEDPAHMVYEWLTFLQGSLVDAVSDLGVER